jgi:hypothetical protein
MVLSKIKEDPVTIVQTIDLVQEVLAGQRGIFGEYVCCGGGELGRCDSGMGNGQQGNLYRKTLAMVAHRSGPSLFIMLSLGLSFF